MLRLIILLLSLFVINGCARPGTSQTETNINALQSEHPSPTPATSAAASSPQQASNAASSPQLKPKLDACAMLTSEEIQSIQGEALKEATEQAGFRVSHGEVIYPGIPAQQFVGEIKPASAPFTKFLVVSRLDARSGGTLAVHTAG